MSLEELRPALLREWKLLLPHSANDVHAQLADRIHLYARGAEVARLVVFEGPEIAARMDFYFDAESGITQLENLFTHPDFRGRCYAQSLINEGLRRGQNAGCRLAFLGADLDDWPTSGICALASSSHTWPTTSPGCSTCWLGIRWPTAVDEVGQQITPSMCSGREC